MRDIHFREREVNIHHPLITWGHLTSLSCELKLLHPLARSVFAVLLLAKLLILGSALKVPKILIVFLFLR